MTRSSFTPYDSVAYLWTALGLPQESLRSLSLPIDAECYPSSFKVDHLAQSSIAISALAAALYWSIRHQSPVPQVTVHAEHACVEFKSERLYALNGKPAPSDLSAKYRLFKTADGHVRIHDSFPSHRENTLKILGLGQDATRADMAEKMLAWNSVDLETEAFRHGTVIAAVRSFKQWDALSQARAIIDFPILLNKIRDSTPYLSPVSETCNDNKCLRGITVIEMSRVIAAPVAGKTLAAHGANVTWITSPTLPSLPYLDIDLSRGKNRVQIDIKREDDKARLLELLRTADVFIQSYRPGSLAAHGLSVEDLVKANPTLIIASLDAYGREGPWSQNRGFDSLVQTCSGINVADAERFGAGEPVRVLPCQAFDHGAGYLLATGIMAALYKRATDGGAYDVRVSLAGVMKYMRSLGQYQGKSGFERKDFMQFNDVEKYLETKQTTFGELKAVRHAAHIEGVEVGWEVGVGKP